MLTLFHLQHSHVFSTQEVRNDFSLFFYKSFQFLQGKQKCDHNLYIDMLFEHLYRIEHEPDYNRLIVNIPPRSMKSYIVNVIWSAWLLGQDPSKRIISISYNRELAKKHAINVRLLMLTEWYQELFPNTEISSLQNTNLKTLTTAHGFRFSTSTGGTLTGEGGDIIIIDDPQNPNKMYSENYRDTTIDWLGGVLMSRLDDPSNGKIMLISQRLHEADLSGYIDNNLEGWNLLKMPMQANEDLFFEMKYKFRIGLDYSMLQQDLQDSENQDNFYQDQSNIPENEVIKINSNNIDKLKLKINPIRPSKIIIEKDTILNSPRYSTKQVLNIKNTIGEYFFASQYQQDPMSRDGGYIKRQWFSQYIDLPQEFYQNIIVSIDTAFKTDTNSDYSVFTIWVKDNNKHYLLDVTRHKFTYPELRAQCIRYIEKYDIAALLIEDRASGHSLIQDIRNENPNITIIAFSPRGNKEERLLSILGVLESRLVYLPRDSNWKEDFLREVTKFPHGRHDDQLDSMVQYLKWSRDRPLKSPKICNL